MNKRESTQEKAVVGELRGYGPRKPLSVKKRYRQNWPAYNQGKVRSGRVDFWIDRRALALWLELAPTKRKRGAQRLYSQLAIEVSLTLGIAYGKPLRETEGFVSSVLGLLGSELPAPDYTTLSRREEQLRPKLQRFRKRLATDEPLHVAVDSTGLKIYGEGEWLRLKHGWSRERTFEMIHLVVDVHTDEIVAVELHDKDVSDADAGVSLLSEASLPEPIGAVYGDGAYDKRKLYRQVVAREAEPIISTRRNAGRWPEREPGAKQRNQAIETARSPKGGFAAWRDQSGYGRRALAETAMSRLKRHTGERLAARNHDSQEAEAILRCSLLNKLAALPKLMAPELRFLPA